MFKIVRNLQSRKHFKQAWTYNCNIKVTTQQSEVKSIGTLEDIKALLPTVDLN